MDASDMLRCSSEFSVATSEDDEYLLGKEPAKTFSCDPSTTLRPSLKNTGVLDPPNENAKLWRLACKLSSDDIIYKEPVADSLRSCDGGTRHAKTKK